MKFLSCDTFMELNFDTREQTIIGSGKNIFNAHYLPQGGKQINKVNETGLHAQNEDFEKVTSLGPCDKFQQSQNLKHVILKKGLELFVTNVEVTGELGRRRIVNAKGSAIDGGIFFFIGDDHFLISDQTHKHIYNVFRASDCSRICRFDSTDFLFCKQSTAPLLLEWDYVQAIIDKKAKKIYPANIRTILHLGARGVHMFSEDMDSIQRNDNKLEIFGLPVPSLALETLSQF